MHKFNLTFSGEILDGHSVEDVKVKFAKLFAIDDPQRVERFFSGDTVVLRRNLNRRAAAEFFLKTRNIGAATELVKALAEQPANDDSATTTPAPPPSRPDPVPTAQATADAETALRERARRVLAERERQASLRGDSSARAAVAKARARLAGRDATEADAQRELQRRQAEEAAQFWAVQERVHQRAAERLTDTVTPRLANRPAPESAASATMRQQGRRRRSDPPNVFALHPFRNSSRIKTRASRADALARTSLGLAIVGAAVFAALAAYRWWQPAPTAIEGPDHVAVSPRGDLALQAGEFLFLHDRSGVGERTLAASALGLQSLDGPLLFSSDRELIVRGTVAAGARPQLLRCNLDEDLCAPLGPPVADDPATADAAPGDDTAISDHPGLALARHPLTGDLYLADPGTGRLKFLDAQGVPIAWVTTPMPPFPTLYIRDGLLLMNSATGPAISVFRLEAHALGQQLDEILLLPPLAVANGQSRVDNFVWSGEHWWVTLCNPETGSTGLYRFDASWSEAGSLPLTPGSRPRQLIAWNEKVLARDPARLDLQRFGSAGQVEVPLSPDLLHQKVEAQRKRNHTADLLWRLGLGSLAFAALLLLLWGLFNRARSGVYRDAVSRGAEPLDKIAALVRWIRPSEQRNQRLRWAWFGYLALSLLAVFGAVQARVGVAEFGALLVMLGSVGLGLYLISRSQPGHIGVIGDKLLLVDHRENYHLGGGDRVAFRFPFVMLDDVIVFTGNRWLPWFERSQLSADIAPIAASWVRIDRTTLLVRLLQNRHPLAVAATGVCAAALLALLILLL